MAIRTFIQNGQGYGPDAVEIQAKVNGVVVFEGAVPTVALPPPVVPFIEADTSTITGKKLFEWELPLEFTGEFTLEIDVVSGGSLVLAETDANYSFYNGPPSPDQFGPFYLGPTGSGDPFITVEINGVVQARARTSETTGQWWYMLSTGDILTAQVGVQAPVTPNSEPVTPA
jgi:hypothetical protein